MVAIKVMIGFVIDIVLVKPLMFSALKLGLHPSILLPVKRLMMQLRVDTESNKTCQICAYADDLVIIE